MAKHQKGTQGSNRPDPKILGSGMANQAAQAAVSRNEANEAVAERVQRALRAAGIGK